MRYIEATYSNKQNKIFAIIGLCGGIICSVADYLLEYLGQPSETLGTWGVVESAWANMSVWRFPASIWIVCLAVPMYVIGFWGIIRQMSSTHKYLGLAFGISTFIGSLGALFIHIIMCVMPVTYKHILENAGQQLAVDSIDAMTGSFIWPFFIFYVFLIIIPLVLWIVYSFKKGSRYSPVSALIVTGLTFVCIAVGSLIPSLEWLAVGAVSRMIAAWCLVALIAECNSAYAVEPMRK